MKEVALKVNISPSKSSTNKVSFRRPGESDNLNSIEIREMIEDAEIVVLRIQLKYKGSEEEARALKFLRDKGLPLNASVRFE